MELWGLSSKETDIQRIYIYILRNVTLNYNNNGNIFLITAHLSKQSCIIFYFIKKNFSFYFY